MGPPTVTLTYAQSLDGSLAALRGRPTAISAPESLRMTHELRAAHDSILVGIGTILSDDPSLTVRHAAGPNPQPIILDSSLRTPLSSKLMTNERCMRPVIIAAHPDTCSSADARTAMLRRKHSLEAAGAAVVTVPRSCSGHGVDLRAAFDRLSEGVWLPAPVAVDASREGVSSSSSLCGAAGPAAGGGGGDSGPGTGAGVLFRPCRVMVEGGACVIQAFLADAVTHPHAPLVTTIVVTIAPSLLLAGEVRVPHTPCVAQAPLRLAGTTVTMAGGDVVVRGDILPVPQVADAVGAAPAISGTGSPLG